METLSVRYSEAFRDSLVGIVNSLSNGDVAAASAFLTGEITDDEAYQLGEVINTYNLVQEAKKADAADIVRVTVTGTFAVGKTDLCRLLATKYHVPSVLVIESIEGNHALSDSVNAEGEARSRALFQSQLHFLRQVVQETAGAVLELSGRGGGLIISDQYEAGHRAIREMKVQEDSLRREDCDLLNRLDDLFRSELPSVSTAEVFLMADPKVVRKRLEKRAMTNPEERQYELESPVYDVQNLSKMQNALLIHAGNLILKQNGFRNSGDLFKAVKLTIPDEWSFQGNSIFIDTTRLNDPEHVLAVVMIFLFKDRNIRRILLNHDS